MRERPLYTGIIGSVGAMSSFAAPMLGRVLVDWLGWRWCFWIGLPLNLTTLVGIFFCLADIKPQVDLTWAQRISQLDLIGHILFVLSLTCLLIALNWAGYKYAWNSPIVISLFCTIGVLLGLFAMEQCCKGDAAALPRRTLLNRPVLAEVTYTFCCNSASMVIEYHLPAYYQKCMSTMLRRAATSSFLWWWVIFFRYSSSL